MRFKAPLVWVLPLAFAWACSPVMDVQVIVYSEAAAFPAKPSDCELATFTNVEDVPKGCCEVGDVLVGDTGWSTNCEHDRVMSEVRSAGCRAGADAFVARQLQDSVSSCYQVRARLYRCPAAGEETARP